MAHQNPINESASSSSTGDANAPLNTNTAYTNTSNTAPTTGTTTHSTVTTHTTNTDTTKGPTTGDKVKGAGSEAKSMLAGIHGLGEKIRGEFNSGVDRAFNEPAGEAKNASVAQQGDNEMYTGQFSHGTKNREGAVPGDHERRRDL